MRNEDIFAVNIKLGNNSASVLFSTTKPGTADISLAFQ